MENLINWLNSNNVDTSKISIINQANNERGVVSRKSIQPNEFVFLIPKKLIITNKVADTIPEIKELDSLFTNKSPTELNIIKITIFIMYAEEYEDIMTDVDWTPYFDTLPISLNHIPIFWTKELDYLKGSYLFERVKERNRLFKEEFRLLKKNLPDFKIFKFYDYQLIRSLVSSRNFKLTINNDIVSGMVPFADMLNHSNTCQTRWSFNNTLQSYEMVAKKPINVGDEIMDSYGIKPMDNYFMFYGFVLPDSEVRVYIKNKYFQGYIKDDFDSKEFHSFLQTIRKKMYDSYDYRDRTSEIKVMKFIYKLLTQVKKKYPHTKNYYNKNKVKGSQNKKNAYTLIVGEINVLDNLLKKVYLIIKYLNGFQVTIENKDVKKYVVDNIIRQ